MEGPGSGAVSRTSLDFEGTHPAGGSRRRVSPAPPAERRARGTGTEGRRRGDSALPPGSRVRRLLAREEGSRPRREAEVSAWNCAQDRLDALRRHEGESGSRPGARAVPGGGGAEGRNQIPGQ